jgi:hypothetical protein
MDGDPAQEGLQGWDGRRQMVRFKRRCQMEGMAEVARGGWVGRSQVFKRRRCGARSER